MSRFDETKPTASSGVQRRDDAFAKRIATRIWDETPVERNDYVADSCRCYGFDLQELMAKRSFIDVIYLLMKGDLPSRDESRLLEKLAIACINPGPRHPATRAAMNAGVGKTDPSLILPIGLTILGGEHLGAAEIEPAIRWLRKNARKDPVETAENLLADFSPGSGDVHIAPGFGSRFGGVDAMSCKLATQLLEEPAAGGVMQWAQQFSTALNAHKMGWLPTGLVAAVLADLGIQPRMGAGLYQIISAPGLFAHGIEMASKALTAMPFPSDDDYHIEYPGAEDDRA